MQLKTLSWHKLCCRLQRDCCKILIMTAGPFSGGTEGGGGRELDKIYIWLEIMAAFGLVILLFTGSDSFKTLEISWVSCLLQSPHWLFLSVSDFQRSMMMSLLRVLSQSCSPSLSLNLTHAVWNLFHHKCQARGDAVLLLRSYSVCSVTRDQSLIQFWRHQCSAVEPPRHPATHTT